MKGITVKKTVYQQRSVVDAYFAKRSIKVQYGTTQTQSYSYCCVSSWSDSHWGLSASEREMMDDWN